MAHSASRPAPSPATQPGAQAGDESRGRGPVVLVPVKAFEQAKGRLGEALGPQARAELARRMATHVVTSQGDVPVAICCDDDRVAEWARSLGAFVIWCPGTGLNGAVRQGFAELGAAGHPQVAIAHSDLPLARSLRPLFGWPGVTIVPDRHRTGTNVMVLPADIEFGFAYGAGSFRRHVIEAVQVGRGLRIVHDARLGWDIDHPDDLAESPGDVSARFLDQAPDEGSLYD